MEQFIAEENNGTLLREDEIGMKLYDIKERFNISRDGYDALIACINKEIMAVYGMGIAIYY